MSEEDTAPFIRSLRITRLIRIEERNTPASPLFDTVAEYFSDALPEWFRPLQAIVEDETFTGMAVTLGKGRVRYYLSIAREPGMPRATNTRTTGIDAQGRVRRLYRSATGHVCGRCGGAIAQGSLFMHGTSNAPWCQACRPFEVREQE